MKKFKICAICLFALGGWQVKAQVYTDPLTLSALGAGAYTLCKMQEETIKQQKYLIAAQGLTTVQMYIANNIQKKLYNGLKNVPSSIEKLNIIQQIRNGVSDCYTYAYEINNLVRKRPDYKEYGKYAKELAKQAVDIDVDLDKILTPGPDNLATSGDRYKLIFNMSEKVNEINRLLCNIKRTIELRSRIDSAYQRKNEKILTNYTNRDKEIMEAVMKEYKDRF